MVDVTPGDSGANKGFWREQLRDRFGKFAEMGQDVMFDVRLPGVDGIVQGLGKFIGNIEPTVARIEVSDNSRVPKGVYEVKHSEITAIKAVLPDAYVEKKVKEAAEEKGLNLKKQMSGSEVLKERLRSVARALKEEGRFPIPRMTPNSTIGKTSDTAKGAKLDYKKVFDAEPALQEKYKTFENMWEAVFKYGVDERTQSPNTIAEIPEDMKELNRAYAKHVLGLDPEGLITFYRNAINSKFTPEESAVGYVSIDRNMAYDYNANFEQRNANGRYEIDVKPGEVFGMIGYSKVEDEYGVTIGREVTSIPNRVRRVGDLASPEIQAPWLEEAANKYRAAYGASPFRGFNMLSEFDFHPVDPLGQTSEEFFQKYNTSAAELKAKFDELYGEGAYDRYKASGSIVSFQRIRDLFVPLPNGQIGLDGAKLEDMGRLVKPEEMVNDLLDNTLKMLSVFQELTGQPFMTHKTRDYTPPVSEEPEDTVSSIYDEFFDGGMIDLRSLRNSSPRVSPYDLDMFSDDQLKSLEWYGQAGHRSINKILRSGEPISDKDQKLINSIDSAIEENGEVFSDSRIFRGDTPSASSDYYKFLEGLTEGDTVDFPGYFSASNDAQLAFSEFGPGQGGSDDDGSNAHLSSTFFWTIDVPEGAKAMAMPEGLGFGQGSESEVVLPRNSKLKILGIKKVEQLDDGGNPTGNYNYFIHASQQL